MEESIQSTHSLCPACLRKIPANKISNGKNIYLEKTGGVPIHMKSGDNSAEI